MSPRIVERSAVAAAVTGARDVEASAFVLAPRSWLVRALEAAADGGARVQVRLQGAFPSGGTGRVRANAATIAELRGHGADAAFAAAAGPAVHLKAVIADGTAFLDDRNWPAGGSDTIVATSDVAEVAAVRSALAGSPQSAGSLTTEKHAALAAEAGAIAQGSGNRVDLATESYGFCAVSKALEARAAAGAAVRVLVTGRALAHAGSQERAALARLVREGVAVRLTDGDEKLCVAGDRGWTGSANATWDVGPTLDWGLSTQDPATVGRLEARFESAWAGARRFVA